MTRIHTNLCIILFLSNISFPASAEVRNIHCTYGDDPKTSITLSWRTNPGDGHVIVEYGETVEYGENVEGIALKSSGGLEHHATIHALKPGTLYHYRIGGEGAPDCTFQTAPEKNEPFRFAVVGDIQGKGNYSDKWRKCSTWVAKQKPAFWLPVGDLVDLGMEQQHWDMFFEAGTPLFQSIVLMAVIGNHDCYSPASTAGRKFKDGRPSLFLNQFKNPSHGIKTLSNYDSFYAFEFSNSLFIVLDAYVHADDGQLLAEAMDITQKQWLETVLSKSKKDFKFTFFHPPVYSSGGHGGDTTDWLNRIWTPAFDQHHVNVAFSGHTHSYEVTYPINNKKIVTDSTEGTIYYNTAGVNYSGPAKGDWFTMSKSPSANFNVVAIVDVFEDRALVKTYNWLNGELYYEFEIKN